MNPAILNFGAGPSRLPPELLAQASADLIDWEGTGLSILELPFSSEEYRTLAARTETDLRNLLNIPPEYHVLFLQGGAYAHMGLLAMNLLDADSSADYIVTGQWSWRAATEASRFGRIRIAASSLEADYREIPPPESWELNPEARYCHITTNETADGIQYHFVPDVGKVPLIADMTSDFLSRPVEVTDFSLIYASAQKNAGITGLTILIIKEDLLDQKARKLPAVYDYGRQASAGSRINTPPVFSIYFTGLVSRWLLDNGGLLAAEWACKRKSELLYNIIDTQPLYFCHVKESDRSLINVCFSLPNPELQQSFLDQAAAEGMKFLEGHASVGGIRASLYNAMPYEGVKLLAEFMEDFAIRNQASRKK